jgi:alpha-beta hydrolase superfamily lysophospholipase
LRLRAVLRVVVTIKAMSEADVTYDYKRMRAEMQPLAEGNGYSADTADYLRFYGFDCTKERECCVGTFESQGKKLAAYIFKPAQYKATVIILHGYLNHSGLMRPAADHLLGQDYAVAMFDLPGHGLSGGKRAAIEDFSQYGCAVSDFLAVIKNDVHGPYHIVAHSTGASAVMENLFASGEDSFDKVVLVAPLVRCGFWRSMQAVRWLFGLCGAVPRIFVKNSSNWHYMAFVLFKDPLQVRTIPTQWLKAMYRWDKRAVQYPSLPRQVKIIQGSRDMTVDWRYNIGFIHDKFAMVDVTMIEGGDHELLNESEAIKSKVYEYISKYLHD